MNNYDALLELQRKEEEAAAGEQGPSFDDIVGQEAPVPPPNAPSVGNAHVSDPTMGFDTGMDVTADPSAAFGALGGAPAPITPEPGPPPAAPPPVAAGTLEQAPGKPSGLAGLMARRAKLGKRKDPATAPAPSALDQEFGRIREQPDLDADVSRQNRFEDAVGAKQAHIEDTTDPQVKEQERRKLAMQAEVMRNQERIRAAQARQEEARAKAQAIAREPIDTSLDVGFFGALSTVLAGFAMGGTGMGAQFQQQLQSRINRQVQEKKDRKGAAYELAVAELGSEEAAVAALTAQGHQAAADLANQQAKLGGLKADRDSALAGVAFEQQQLADQAMARSQALAVESQTKKEMMLFEQHAKTQGAIDVAQAKQDMKPKGGGAPKYTKGSEVSAKLERAGIPEATYDKVMATQTGVGDKKLPLAQYIEVTKAVQNQVNELAAIKAEYGDKLVTDGAIDFTNSPLLRRMATRLGFAEEKVESARLVDAIKKDFTMQIAKQGGGVVTDAEYTRAEDQAKTFGDIMAFYSQQAKKHDAVIRGAFNQTAAGQAVSKVVGYTDARTAEAM